MYQKRYRRKFTRRPRKSSGWAGVAQKALKVAKFVRTLVNVERKFCDTSQIGLLVNISGGVIPLSLIGQGSDYNQRNGNSVKLTSMYMRAYFDISTSQPWTQIRTLVFRDMEGRGSLPAVTDVLETANVTSPLNHLNGSRFKILFDKFQGFSNQGTNTQHFKIFRKLNTHLKFQGTTAAQASLDEGAIYVLFISDQATNIPAVTYYSRLRYIDN